MSCVLIALMTAFVSAPAENISPTLSAYASAINGAKSLDSTYIVQQVGGSRAEYSVQLQKPNLARIDEPGKLIVADGHQITTYDKTQNVFVHEPETDAGLRSLFSIDPLGVWSGFFNQNAYQPTASRDLGQVAKGSNTFLGVEAKYGPNGEDTITYLLDPSDNVLRQATFLEGNGQDKTTSILFVRNVSINGSVNPNAFAFLPPSGSKEVSLADIQGAKWFTDVSEAEKAAGASGKKIFVDFFATWCGPCKMLQHEVLETQRFKDLAVKKLVLLRIDVDAQKDVAQTYGITAMPTQMVLDANGHVLKQTVGYGGPEMFYQFLDSAL